MIKKVFFKTTWPLRLSKENIIFIFILLCSNKKEEQKHKNSSYLNIPHNMIFLPRKQVVSKIKNLLWQAHWNC